MISFITMKETLNLERTVSLLQWAQTTPGVNLQLLNYAEVKYICEGRTGACMSEVRAWNLFGGCVSQAHGMDVVHVHNLYSESDVPSVCSCFGNPNV